MRKYFAGLPNTTAIDVMRMNRGSIINHESSGIVGGGFEVPVIGMDIVWLL